MIPREETQEAVWRSMYRASSYNVYTNQEDAQKFLWLDFYFLLDAVHVSDYISLSSGATL